MAEIEVDREMIVAWVADKLRNGSEPVRLTKSKRCLAGMQLATVQGIVFHVSFEFASSAYPIYPAVAADLQRNSLTNVHGSAKSRSKIKAQAA